jgi:hypothetical protein
MIDHQEQVATDYKTREESEISLNVSGILSPDKETLSTIFAEIKERVSSQQNAISLLENKADKMIGFVSLFTGLAIAGMQFFLKNDLPQLLSKKTLIISCVIYVGGAICFLISICLAFVAYKVESYRSDPNPWRLAEKYLFYPHDKLLKQLIDNLADSYKANERIMRRKAKFVRLSLLSFIIGLTIIFSFLVFLLVSKV